MKVAARFAVVFFVLAVVAWCSAEFGRQEILYQFPQCASGQVLVEKFPSMDGVGGVGGTGWGGRKRPSDYFCLDASRVPSW